jgi:hypothetical protein
MRATPNILGFTLFPAEILTRTKPKNPLDRIFNPAILPFILFSTLKNFNPSWGSEGTLDE